jgi:hypothetical protein
VRIARPPDGDFVGRLGSIKCRCIPTLQRRANRLAVEPASQIGGSIDVTSSVTGGGEVNLALSGPGSAAISMSSREGTNKPQLVVAPGGAQRASHVLDARVVAGGFAGSVATMRVGDLRRTSRCFSGLATASTTSTGTCSTTACERSRVPSATSRHPRTNCADAAAQDYGGHKDPSLSDPASVEAVDLAAVDD